VILTRARVHPLHTGGVSEALMSETAETIERPEEGPTRKRGRKDQILLKDAAEPPPAVPPAVTQGYCLVCGDTSCERFRSAPVGIKVAVVLILGKKFKNFNGQVDVCRTCNRACGPELIEACEALVVSLPTSSSVGPPLRLPVPQPKLWLRKHFNALRVGFAGRGSVVLYEKLLAVSAEAPSRFAGDQLVLLPVPTGYAVHVSSRYCSG